MKITIDITRVVPKYLMIDRNGYAIAKAIEKAFQYVAKAAEDGLDIILDVEKMPEWRLDEMAKELNCLYDYTADVENKRDWIRNATVYYYRYGTPDILKKYLEAVFDNAIVQEWYDYEEEDGDPYHFRVIVTGVYTQAGDEWARKAINRAKNVRSILDELRFNAGESIANVAIGAACVGVEIIENCVMY